MFDQDLIYNKDLFDFLTTKPNTNKLNLFENFEKLGKGANGETFVVNIKSDKDFGKVVLKKQERNKHSKNEVNALKYIREQMLEQSIPAYFIFLYDTFTVGRINYLVMEKASMSLDDYMTENNLSKTEMFLIFKKISMAVDYLEEKQFNHGDLWSENVMIKWKDDDRKDYDIKIIDFDAAYKKGCDAIHPSFGASEYYRTKFILGYDLNRFFDCLIYSYEKTIEMKNKYKKRCKAKNNREEKIKKYNEEVDEENIVYPQEIIDFLYKLGTIDPTYKKDMSHLEAKKVLKMLL